MNSRLYVIGGATGQGWSTGVRSASIGPDGHVGSWRSESPLIESRSYISSAVAVAGTRIYVVGGNTSRRPNTPDPELRKTQDVLWTEAASDGSLRPWRRSAPFPGSALSCAGACSDGKNLIITGGSNNTDISDGVLSARLSDTGEPAQWTVSGRLPTPIWFHGTGILKGRVYVWGGLTRRDRSFVNPRVFSAILSPEGGIGEWREEAPMRHAVYSAAFLGAGGHLLCAGGRYANTYPTNVMWVSRLHDTGALADWNMFKTNLDSWVNHAAAFDPKTGIVFITGGNRQTAPTDISGELQNSVQAFRLAPPE